MRILVTGGSGYIGAHTVLTLADAGHDPVILDLRPPPPAIRRLGIEAVAGDIREAATLQRVLGGRAFDGVLHFAAEKSVAASIADPAAFMDTNVAGTRRVLEAAVAAGVGSFVFSSSCAVYGTPDRLPVDETAALRPQNPYGESKLLAERLLPEFERHHGLRSIALRYFNAGGAAPDGQVGEDWRHAPNLLPVAIEAALGRGQPIEVYGSDHPTPDGTAVRDYVHVVDLAEAHLAALAALTSGGTSDILNLGTGRGTSVRQVLDAVGQSTGNAVPHRLVARRAGEASAVWADATRAERVLGWRARFGLGDIVETAVAWHRRGDAALGGPAAPAAAGA